ncbi:hypothetical protein [Mycobacteroides chelonae]
MWISWLIALGALVAGVYYFLYNKRRKTLELDANVTSLLASAATPREELEIRFKEQVVRDPHILDFHIRNAGPKDISTKDFDAEKPLQIKCDFTIVSRLEVLGAEDAPMVVVGEDSRSLLLMPYKIGAGCRYQMRALVDGKARLKIQDDPLIDTNVVFGIPQRIKEYRRLAALMIATALLAFVDVAAFACVHIFRDQVQTRTISFLGDMPTAPWWAVFVVYSSPIMVIMLSFGLAYGISRIRTIKSNLYRVLPKAND